MSLKDRILADLSFLADFRHDLHQHPELMFEERRTSEKVQAVLADSGISFQAGLAKGTGIVGWLPPTQPGGKVVALRADMDALPIHEETGVPYASTIPGKMHACGHDGHTTILVGAARALAQEEVRPNGVIFVFQPAEEGGGGAEILCQEGALSGKVIGEPADVIYGLHGWPARPEGRFSTRSGPLMAGTDQFFVTLQGRGGHAATPELTTDVVACLGQLITALQNIVSRSVAPVESAVLTIATVHAGQATNVIPHEAKFSGTIRTLDQGIKALVKARFYQVVEGICSAMNVTPDIHWEEGYPVTFNDDWATQRWLEVARETAGEGKVAVERHPKLGAEDFSYYGHHIPACFYFVGLCREGESDPAGLHTPNFDFNDNVIPDCVEMMCRLALEPVRLP